ncbi:ABC transporter substrate-binding protein [Streptomyces stramineus]
METAPHRHHQERAPARDLRGGPARPREAGTPRRRQPGRLHQRPLHQEQPGHRPRGPQGHPLPLPREQARQVLGGPRVGDFATTLSSPAVVGWKKYDLYPVRPAGDIEKAKEHLARAKDRPRSLTYAYETESPQDDRLAQVLVDAFAKAGIQLVTKPLEPAAFTSEVFRGDAPYDLWISTNSVDWPTPPPCCPTATTASSTPSPTASATPTPPSTRSWSASPASATPGRRPTPSSTWSGPS